MTQFVDKVGLNAALSAIKSYVDDKAENASGGGK